MPADTYDLKQLCELAGVTPRTVYYYIQQGLLPHPGARGQGAKYERRHLHRLQLIRKLKAEHLPLAEIRERLAALSDVQVEQAVSGAAGAPAISSAKRGQSGARLPGTPPAAPARSQWDRIALTRDVELHIRRPLSRERNRQVERLLEEARRIIKKGDR